MDTEVVSINELLEIGLALTRERDQDQLLQLIMEKAIQITSCDRGILYLMNTTFLRFKVMIAKFRNTYDSCKDTDDFPPIELSDNHVCAYAARNRELVNVADIYSDSQFDFSSFRRYDSMAGYRTVSMLAVPMEDDKGDVIGVLQLMNRMDEQGKIVPFDPIFEPVICSLASQAAICLANMNYSAEVVKLLESFVAVMSDAIDARTPYNANHTRNMVQYGERFIDWLNRYCTGWNMSEQERKEFLMSVQLHDIGKLLIPLEIMDKSDRLGQRMKDIKDRFRVIRLCNKLRKAKGQISEKEYEDQTHRLNECMAFIEQVNVSGFLADEVLEQVDRLSQYSYFDENGQKQPWILPQELEALRVRKGTLTDEERHIMQNHVNMTERMLGKMAFSKNYQRVPMWAADHHEFLNGKGYPHGKRMGEIPREVRLLTILDVFEALTAKDRPYKQPMPVEAALEILDSMERDGQIDGEILSLFKESRAWEE